MAGRVPAIRASTVGRGWPGHALRDAHVSETAMKPHEIKCLLDDCERFPIVIARLVRMSVKIERYDVRPLLWRHGRAWPGHPRLAVPNVGKSWMAGIKPAMT